MKKMKEILKRYTTCVDSQFVKKNTHFVLQILNSGPSIKDVWSNRGGVSANVDDLDGSAINRTSRKK